MNRIEYMNKLRMYLRDIPQEELEDILSDYEEHFQIGLSKGKREDEISKELGEPYDIASNYKSNTKTSNANMDDNDITRKLFMAIILGAFNMFLVFIPYMVIVFGVLGTIYGLSIGSLFGGLGGLFGTMLSQFNFFNIGIILHPLTKVSFSVGFTSIGVLGLMLAFYLTQTVYKLTVKYIKWNIDTINKGGF